MKKREHKPIDLTHLGPIDDVSPDGYLDCTDAFCKVLKDLFSRVPFPLKSQKIRVCYSNLNYKEKIPSRFLVERITTFSALCCRYKEEFNKPFSLEEQKKQDDSELEQYRMQGQKQMAWSSYAQYVDYNRAINQERIIQNLPKVEQAAKREEFKKNNGSALLRIG